MRIFANFDKMIICICIIISISVAGCVNSSSSAGESRASWHSGGQSTVQIPNNGYKAYPIYMKEGSSEKISIATDGNPIDLMVMDSLNYGIYSTLFKNQVQGALQARNDLRIIKDEYTFTAPTDSTYYFVLDNTKFPANGAFSGNNVNVNVIFSSYY